jgi:hypothetical protein
MSERIEQAAVVEPVDPLERRELDVVDAAPGPATTNHLRFEEPDDRLSEGVVIRVADAADGPLHTRLGEALGVTDRQVAHLPTSTRCASASQRNLSSCGTTGVP